MVSAALGPRERIEFRREYFCPSCGEDAMWSLDMNMRAKEEEEKCLRLAREQREHRDKMAEEFASAEEEVKNAEERYKRTLRYFCPSCGEDAMWSLDMNMRAKEEEEKCLRLAREQREHRDKMAEEFASAEEEVKNAEERYKRTLREHLALLEEFSRVCLGLYAGRRPRVEKAHE
ncbi:hypothetical protein COOONC_02179 [Cooperia oncophora]